MPHIFRENPPWEFPEELKSYDPDLFKLDDAECPNGSKADAVLGLKYDGFMALESLGWDPYQGYRQTGFLGGPDFDEEEPEKCRVCPGRNDPAECPKTVERKVMLPVQGRAVSPFMPLCIFRPSGFAEMFYHPWIQSGPPDRGAPCVALEYDL